MVGSFEGRESTFEVFLQKGGKFTDDEKGGNIWAAIVYSLWLPFPVALK